MDLPLPTLDGGPLESKKVSRILLSVANCVWRVKVQLVLPNKIDNSVV